MNAPRVATHAGVSVNLATIKCFRTDNDIMNYYALTIECKTRYDFIQHPETGEWQKQEYNETVEIPFHSYDSAVAHRNEWVEIWQDYLDDQG